MKNLLLFTIAIVLLLIPGALMFLWIKIAINTVGFEAALTEYLSYFPEVIRGGRLITYINVVMLAGSVGSFIYLIIKFYLKIFSIILLVIGSILLFWNLFSLM